MKRICIFLVVIFLAGTATADTLRFTIRADWMLTVRAGIEYRFGRYFGVQADFGTNVRLLVADVCAVVYGLDESSPWQVNLLLGVPNAGMPIFHPAGFVSLGASVGVGYQFPSGTGIDARFGGGFPFFFEDGRDVVRDVAFPLGLWPDLALGMSFPQR